MNSASWFLEEDPEDFGYQPWFYPWILRILIINFCLSEISHRAWIVIFDVGSWESWIFTSWFATGSCGYWIFNSWPRCGILGSWILKFDCAVISCSCLLVADLQRMSTREELTDVISGISLRYLISEINLGVVVPQMNNKSKALVSDLGQWRLQKTDAFCSVTMFICVMLTSAQMFAELPCPFRSL